MFEKGRVESGYYVRLALQENGDLIATINRGKRREARREIAEAKINSRYTDDRMFQEFIQDFIDNGDLQFITDEDKEHYGMLTGCELILAEDADVLDCGHAIIHGRIWWHDRYALDDAIESLLSKDGLRLAKGADADENAPAPDKPITCPWCGRVTE